MITLYVHYSNRTEYYPFTSQWAANLIAIDAMRQDIRIEYVEMVDNVTKEIYKTYVRG